MEEAPGSKGASGRSAASPDEKSGPENVTHGELFVSSVEKAFRILELYASARTELGLSEVSRQTGLGKSATQRFLHTLSVLGYLVQDRQTKAFRLSAKMLGLSGAQLELEILKSKAHPILQAANAACEETINLTVLEDTNIVYVLRYPSKHVVSVDVSLGYKLPVFCTAPGRVFLAGMSQEMRTDILNRSELRKRTEQTIVDRARLSAIIDKVARDGYCIADQESFVGDISTAAPIFDRRGVVVAAANIAVPYPRWSVAAVRKKLTPIAVESARQISAAMSV